MSVARTEVRAFNAAVNISTALTNAAAILQTAGVADPRREAASLLALALDKPNTFLIAHPEYELTTDETMLFNSHIARREQREPFQYIAGRQEFYGLDFEAAPAVLIPRPETEILVEEAIKELQKLDGPPRFCEIGVGSGCISVSILANVPTAKAVATDISAAAIEVARRNAERHRVGSRLQILEGDLFENVAAPPFEMIVSNPPYIPDPDQETLQAEVRNFEPRSALFAGGDGLDIVRRLIEEAPKHLVSGGMLLIEIGDGQAEAVSRLFAADRWKQHEFLNDLAGISRTVKAVLS